MNELCGLCSEPLDGPGHAVAVDATGGHRELTPAITLCGRCLSRPVREVIDAARRANERYLVQQWADGAVGLWTAAGRPSCSVVENLVHYNYRTLQTEGQVPNINIPVDPELHERLRVAAYEDRRRQTEIVREALEQWLARRETERRGGGEAR